MADRHTTDHAGDVNQHFHWQPVFKLQSEDSFFGDIGVDIWRAAQEKGHQLDEAGIREM